jgi:hypothetical protein
MPDLTYVFKHIILTRFHAAEHTIRMAVVERRAEWALEQVTDSASRASPN